MKTKVGKYLAVLSMLGFLVSCAQTGALEGSNTQAHKAAESASTYADHERVAKQYENTAKELLLKAEEQKKLLQHYEEKSYLYGRQAQDYQSHTAALLHKYRQTAEESIKQATLHHRMASELAQDSHAAREDNRENKAAIGTDGKDWSAKFR